MSTLQQAFARHQAGNPAGAVPLYREFLAAHPDHAEALHLLGVALMQSGDLEAARATLERAVARDGANPHYLNNLGLARFHGNEFAGARACFEKALAINPTDPDVHNNLGMALQNLDEPLLAVAHFQEARKGAGSDPEILHNLGVALQTAGRMVEARAAFESALKHSGGMPDTYASLAALLADMGDVEGGYQACWAAVRLDPFHLAAHECFKRLKWDAGLSGEIHDTYRWVCDLRPGHPRSHLQYGRALLVDRMLEAAEESFRRALALNANMAEAHSGLGAVLSIQGRHDEAIDTHAHAAALAPENPEILEAQGNALLRAAQYRSAIAVLKAAHRLNPRRSNVLGLLTIAMTEAGDREVAGLVDYDDDVTTHFIDPPAGFADVASFNAALHEELLARHRDLPPPVNQTMAGGTQIPGHLFAGPSGMVLKAKEQIAKTISGYIAGLRHDPLHPFRRFINPNFRFTGAWSTILHGAGYDASHIHNEGWLSGVYYVQVPDLPEECWRAGEGCLQVGAPPDAYLSERNRIRRFIRPRPGMLVLFPSYVWHGVRPFTQPGTRHSIAFDLR